MDPYGATPAQRPRLDYTYDPYDRPQNFCCPPCEISFSSYAHAQQHFKGRNHKRVLSGLAPLRSGYFNTQRGKWQREPLEEETAISPDSEAFTLSTGHPAPPPPLPPPPPPPPGPGQEGDPDPVKKFNCSVCGVVGPSGPQCELHLNRRNHKAKCAKEGISSTRNVNERGKSDNSKDGKKYECQPCGVTATSQVQLDMHLNGRNHKTRKAKLTPITSATSLGTLVHQITNVKPSIMKSVTSSSSVKKGKVSFQLTQPKLDTPEVKPKKKDYSIYRTPSGQYYCALCNLCVNSENQFVQHVASRKHKLKESSAKSKKSKTKK